MPGYEKHALPTRTASEPPETASETPPETVVAPAEDPREAQPGKSSYLSEFGLQGTPNAPLSGVAAARRSRLPLD